MSIIIGIIFLTLAINIKHKLFFALSLYLYYGVFALLVCCIAFLTSGIFILDATYNIFLTITCFLLGYCCKNQTLSFIYRCMKVNILSALFLGLFSVFTNLGGFVISEQYAFSVKNSSGVLLGIAIVLCAFVIKESNVKCSTALWWVVMFLLAVCLLTFRCRTVIISVTMCLIYFLYKNNILYRLLQPIILLYIISIIILLNIFNLSPIGYIYDSLFSNTNVNDLNSVTSGRLDTYDIGWQVFSESPMFGNKLMHRSIPPVDNFIIGNLTFYGVVGALLLFPPYFYTWYICLKGLWHQSISNLIPFCTLFLICMSSFTEGSFPFGPGTPVICSWFLLGWWYNFKRIE